MSIRSDRKDTTPNAATVLQDAATADAALSEGNSFTTSTPENPLNRELVVSIRASLNQLCLQKNKGTWAPTGSALKQIFQQRKFVSLDGSADQQGDLKAVVLHNLSVNAAKSTFPISLGTRITGVDDATFSSTGEAFSMICLPNSESSTERKLQADDVSLAYEFAKKFPVSDGLESLYFFAFTFMYSLLDAALFPGWLHLYVSRHLLTASVFCLFTTFSSSLSPMASHFSSRFLFHVSSLHRFASTLRSSTDTLALAARLVPLCLAKNSSTLLASSLSPICAIIASRLSPWPCEILALVSSHRGPLTKGPSLRLYPEWRCPPFSTLYPLGHSVSCTAISLTSSASNRSSLMPSTSTSFFMFSHPYFLIAHAIGAVPLWD